MTGFAAELVRPLRLVPERDGEDDGEHEQQPRDVPGVADAEAGAAQPPGRQWQEPDPGEAWARDRERQRGEREVVQPDDRRDRQRRGDGEREAPVAPRRREQERGRRPTSPPSRPSPTRRSAPRARRACTSPGRTRGRAAGATAHSRRSRRRGGGEGGTRRRCRPRPARRRSAAARRARARSARRRTSIAVANPTRMPGWSGRSRARQASARSRQMGAVRCETRISPAICGHIATRPYTRQSRNPTIQSEAAMHASPSTSITTSATPSGSTVSGARR